MPDALIELTVLVSIHAIAALGLYFQIASAQLNIAQAAIVGLAGYASAGLTSALGLPFWLSLVLVPIGASVTAALLAAAVLRLSHFFYAIATLAFGQSAVIILSNLAFAGGPLGVGGVRAHTTRPLVYVSLVAILAISLVLSRSPILAAARACGDDPEVAASIGCDPRALRVAMSALSGLFAGYAGVLYVHYITAISPATLGFGRSLDYLLYVAVGGMTTVLGPLLGTVGLIYLPEVLRFSDSMRYIIFGLALVVLMRTRPLGLLTRRPTRFVGRPGRGEGGVGPAQTGETARLPRVEHE